MAARDIEYVELYTFDKRIAVDYFVSSLGFTQVAESADRDRASTLLRQGTMQLIVTAGSGAQDFLDAHGDGIADIAFTCDDVAATRDAAVAAGASLIESGSGGPVVSGFGRTRHTLLPLPAGPESRLPARYGWTATSPALIRPAGRILLLDHVAVCLEAGTMADYADFYRNAFGLTRYSAEYVEVGDQAMDSLVVRSPAGGITFTLLEPDSTKHAGQIDAFLARNGGAGVQHLAFRVADIIHTVREFRARGVEFLSTPGSYYDMLSKRLNGVGQDISGLRAANVLVDRDEWGYLLQLFTRSPHDRNTLFYELIQRQGARGFGSANIRALYDAVERDRLASL